jgi:poly-gamma-glutamate system protein
MKRVYWRPRTVSQTVVVLVALVALLGLVAVETFRVQVKQPHYEEKVAAVELAQECMRAIKYRRLEIAEALRTQSEAQGMASSQVGPAFAEDAVKTSGGAPEYLDYEINADLDPAETGLIGAQMSAVTSVPGHLPSKHVSTNPNFAAVIVDMLTRAGVQAGDHVAVGCSGSFPALNVAVYSAIATLGAKPVVISSAGASQFGANLPRFLWIDMERTLIEKGLIPKDFRSVACSIGGQEDLGLNMSDEARRLVLQAIKDRNKLKLVQSRTYEEAIADRMQIYSRHAGGEYACYVNVGGGTISVGRTLGKKLYDPGLNLRPSRRALQVDSIMSRFARDGVPVVHLVQIEQLGVDYGLTPPEGPETPARQGIVFERTARSRLLALGVLIVILISLRALVLTDLGFRLFKGRPGKKSTGEPEPMV